VPTVQPVAISATSPSDDIIRSVPPTFSPVTTLARPPSIRHPPTSTSTSDIWESSTPLSRPSSSDNTTPATNGTRQDSPTEFGEFVDVNEVNDDDNDDEGDRNRRKMQEQINDTQEPSQNKGLRG
jgi:hypothetical protein